MLILRTLLSNIWNMHTLLQIMMKKSLHPFALINQFHYEWKWLKSIARIIGCWLVEYMYSFRKWKKKNLLQLRKNRGSLVYHWAFNNLAIFSNANNYVYTKLTIHNNNNIKEEKQRTLYETIFIKKTKKRLTNTF